jgi:hypothetical protein
MGCLTGVGGAEEVVLLCAAAVMAAVGLALLSEHACWLHVCWKRWQQAGVIAYTGCR